MNKQQMVSDVFVMVLVLQDKGVKLHQEPAHLPLVSMEESVNEGVVDSGVYAMALASGEQCVKYQRIWAA